MYENAKERMTATTGVAITTRDNPDVQTTMTFDERTPIGWPGRQGSYSNPENKPITRIRELHNKATIKGKEGEGGRTSMHFADIAHWCPDTDPEWVHDFHLYMLVHFHWCSKPLRNRTRKLSDANFTSTRGKNRIKRKELNTVLRLINALVYIQDNVSKITDYQDDKYDLPWKYFRVPYPIDLLYDTLHFMNDNHKHPITNNTPPNEMDIYLLSCYNWIIAKILYGMDARYFGKQWA